MLPGSEEIYTATSKLEECQTEHTLSLYDLLE